MPDLKPRSVSTSTRQDAHTVTARIDHQPRAQGERLIPADACQYPPTIEPSDLLLVDFDRRNVERSALYLVEEVRDGDVVWRGCRRFDLGINGVRIDVSGDGEWQDYAAPHWRIAGEVKQVFKPSL